MGSVYHHMKLGADKFKCQMLSSLMMAHIDLAYLRYLHNVETFLLSPDVSEFRFLVKEQHICMRFDISGLARANDVPCVGAQC